jgi:hypothetical protein
MSRHFLPGCCRAVVQVAARVPARPLRPQGPSAAARRPAAALDPGDLWRAGRAAERAAPRGCPETPRRPSPALRQEPCAGRAGTEGAKRYWTRRRKDRSVNTCSIASTSKNLKDHLLASHEMKPQPKPGWSIARPSGPRATHESALVMRRSLGGDEDQGAEPSDLTLANLFTAAGHGRQRPTLAVRQGQFPTKAERRRRSRPECRH